MVGTEMASTPCGGEKDSVTEATLSDATADVRCGSFGGEILSHETELSSGSQREKRQPEPVEKQYPQKSSHRTLALGRLRLAPENFAPRILVGSHRKAFTSVGWTLRQEW